MNYTQGFKARMVQRMAGPEGISATALSKEVGIQQPTLSRWLREARAQRSMASKEDDRESHPKSPRKWSAEEKLRVVFEASTLSEEELGAFLRKKGIHKTQLDQWCKAATEAATEALKGSKRRKKSKLSSEAKRIKELEKDLRRKEKALAEVTALLALKKKVAEIWGDEDEDTDTGSET